MGVALKAVASSRKLTATLDSGEFFSRLGRHLVASLVVRGSFVHPGRDDYRV